MSRRRGLTTRCFAGAVAALVFVLPAAASGQAARQVAERASDHHLAQRRAYVNAMSAAEKEKLKRNYQRFQNLDEAKRKQLRALQAKIATAPDSERMWAVLQLYHQWMQSLTSGERLQLLALPAEQRVRAIKKLIERQERDRFQALVQKSLSAEDRETIITWMSALALSRLPQSEQQRLRAIEQPMRRRMEAMAIFRRRSGGMNDTRFLEGLKPTAAERQELIQRLSQSAQDTIAAAKDDPEKRRLLQTWVNAAIFSRRGNRPGVTKEALEKFFANLDAAEKDYLNNLPPDGKREELERLYMRYRMRRPGDGRGGFGPLPGRRNGVD